MVSTGVSKRYGQKKFPEDTCSWLAKMSFTLVMILFLDMALVAQGKTFKYGRTVRLGLTIVKIDNDCVTLNATMSAGDFFAGLKRVETSHGHEFYSRGKRVYSYPALISVEVTAMASSCNGPLDVVPVSQAVRELLASIHLSVLLDDGNGEQPVHTSTATTRRALPWSELTEGRYFALGVETGEASLNSQLAIQVIAPNGDKLAQFNFRL